MNYVSKVWAYSIFLSSIVLTILIEILSPEEFAERDGILHLLFAFLGFNLCGLVILIPEILVFRVVYNKVKLKMSTRKIKLMLSLTSIVGVICILIPLLWVDNILWLRALVLLITYYVIVNILIWKLEYVE